MMHGTSPAVLRLQCRSYFWSFISIIGNPMVGSESSKDLEIGELDPRTEMLSAVAYVATRIVGGGSWRDNVPELLERLGQATRMSRVTLFEAHLNDFGGLVQSCRYDWAEPGLERISMDPRYHNMPLVQPDGTLDEWSQSRMRGETWPSCVT
jgi:hypothetical protein